MVEEHGGEGAFLGWEKTGDSGVFWCTRGNRFTRFSESATGCNQKPVLNRLQPIFRLQLPIATLGAWCERITEISRQMDRSAGRVSNASSWEAICCAGIGLAPGNAAGNAV
jgi:hypothetical protein